MSDENTAQPGGGEALPASSTTPAPLPAPKNDAEAAEREAAEAAAKAQQPPDGDEKKKADEEAKQADEKKRNRTREYINRINTENAEMRRRLAELEQRSQPTAGRHSQPAQTQQAHDAAKPPKLEDYNYDFEAWQQATLEYQAEQLQKRLAAEQKQAETTRSQQETQARYDASAAAFADAHPDFYEVVGSIDPSFLTVELQAAIIGHEKGPEIAYHLANNEDDLWQLASIRADLLPAAVARLASRLGAAQPPVTPAANAPEPQQSLPPKRPVSQTPPPPPTVTGRSPTEIPPEKLTDDEWYARDRERRRKR